MPFLARALGWDRPWRAGASLREVDASDRIVALLECDDAALGDIQSWCRELAQTFPEARLSAALRDEAGGSTLIEVSAGQYREHVLELVDPDTDLPFDPDGEDAFPELAVEAAEQVAAVLGERFGVELDVTDANRVEIPVDHDDPQACAEALGVLAQLAGGVHRAVICADGVHYRADLSGVHGCRLRPLELRHSDRDVVRRFSDLAKLAVARAIDWTKPPIPAGLSPDTSLKPK